MTSVNRPTALRTVQFLTALAFLLLTLTFASSAFATNVNLRVEGSSATLFNGAVNTGPRSVPGGTNYPYCHANTAPAVFSTANTLTALADAVGAANVETSGTYNSWGVQLCSVFGEGTPAIGGWLVKINNTNVTAPNGYVTATDELKDGDTAELYRVTDYDGIGTLDLKAPAAAKPNESVAVQLSAYADSDDSKSTPAGITVSGGGASATTNAAGQAVLNFPAAGRFLITAEKAGYIRGSAWVTIDPASVQPALRQAKKVNRFVKCKTSHHSRKSSKFKRCIRIVRAKQAAEAKKK